MTNRIAEEKHSEFSLSVSFSLHFTHFIYFFVYISKTRKVTYMYMWIWGVGIVSHHAGEELSNTLKAKKI